MLVKKVGWRLVEIEEGKQVRLADLLAELPSKTYKSADEILKLFSFQFNTIQHTLNILFSLMVLISFISGYLYLNPKFSP